MSFVTTVMFAIAITLTAPAPGQSNHERFTSDLHTAGRKFACTDEIVTYNCNSFGSGVIVNFPPLFSGHQGFNRSDPIPSTIIIDSNSTTSIAILTLLLFAEPDDLLNVNLQIRMPDFTGRFTEPVNVSCSHNSGSASSPDDFTTEVLPLIQETQSDLIEPPSAVTLVGLTGDTTRLTVRVSWTPPVDPQFDIDHYLVTLYSDLMTVTRISKNTSIDMEMPLGRIFAEVATVTYCGSESRSASSIEVIESSGAFYAAFLIPTFIGVLLLIAVVVLAILLVRATMKGQSS